MTILAYAGVFVAGGVVGTIATALAIRHAIYSLMLR